MESHGRTNNGFIAVLGDLLVTGTIATFTGIGRVLWRYRLEAWLIVFTVANALLVNLYVTVGAWVLLLAIPPVRDGLSRSRAAGTIRRRWTRACTHSGMVGDLLPYGPIVQRVQPVRVGYRLDVRVASCVTAADLEAHVEELATSLRAITVRVESDTALKGKDRAAVTIVMKDPFLNAPPDPWPDLDSNEVSVWEPTIIGMNDDGAYLRRRIVGNHILVGGITGGGKSVFLRPLLATAALSKDPCALWLFDAKVMELAPWAKAAQEFVGRDGPLALEVLRYLVKVADERQQEIVEAGGDKLRRSAGLPVHAIVIDELAAFTELDEGKEIMKALRNLASRGRALGITLIGATQIPHSNLIDTTLRNQFSIRVGFRCADRHHAGTIFGQPDAAAAAAEISDLTPGVGYALDETGRYVRFRSVLIGRPDDEHPDRSDDVLTVVRRAHGARPEWRRPGLPERGLPGVTPEGGNNRGNAGDGNQDVAPRRVEPSAAEVFAAEVAAVLTDEGCSQAEVCRRLGRDKTDGRVRRALTALQADGRAVKVDGRWQRPDGRSATPHATDSTLASPSPILESEAA
jgi:hypothetical protein